MILVVEYDSAWPMRFDQLRREYAQAMAAAGVPVVSTEHVGSTAVPGLAAKPVNVQDSLSLRNHLAVRDILRADPCLREQYAAVKRRVGAIAVDIDEYGKGKNAMVQRILAAAGLTAAERASIDANQVPSHDEVPR